MARLGAAHWALLSAALPVTKDESVSAREVSAQLQQAQPALQQAERPRAPPKEAGVERAPLEQQAQQPTHLLLEQQELVPQEQQVARLAPPEPRAQRMRSLARRLAPKVSPPHSAVAQPPAPQKPRAAFSQPWQPLPSQPFPPLRKLPPQLPPRPVPKGSCELSRLRPRGSSSSASSSP